MGSSSLRRPRETQALKPSILPLEAEALPGEPQPGGKRASPSQELSPHVPPGRGGPGAGIRQHPSSHVSLPPNTVLSVGFILPSGNRSIYCVYTPAWLDRGASSSCLTISAVFSLL